MVSFSFRPPTANYLGFPASAAAIVETACLAEELGYDAILVNDHILVDDSPRAVPWTQVYDPLVTLSYLAARTRSIRLGTSVLILPYRNPMATAKMFATLDQMSGGRVIVGVGSGWAEAEFNALGIPFRERGARTSEYLALMQACWAPGPTTFKGKFFAFEGMHLNPKPIQQPHPPILIGGSSEGVLRRAVRFAQIWQPMQMPPEELCTKQAHLASACEAVGRTTPPTTRLSIRVTFSSSPADFAARDRPLGQGTPEQVAQDLSRYHKECGVEAFQINFGGCKDVGQLKDWMGLFMREVKPRVTTQVARLLHGC